MSGNPRRAVQSRTGKVLAILAFNLLSIAAIVAWTTPPANRYELSIYTALPPSFWVLTVLSLFMGALVVLETSRHKSLGSTWIAGIAVIVGANLLLMGLPSIRGYVYLGRWDELTHIGFMLDIIETRQIGAVNFYPLDHLLGVTVYWLADRSINEVLRYVPPFFSLYYVISLYTLARHLFGKTKETLLSVLLGSILIFGPDQVSFAPASQSFFLMPSIIYVYFRSRSSRGGFEFTGLLILLLLFVIFFHPMTSFYLVVVLLCLELAPLVRKRYVGNHHASAATSPRRHSLNLMLTTVAIFFLWYFAFAAITRSFAALVNWLVFQSGTSQAQTYAGIIATADVRLVDLLLLAVFTYGQLIVLTVLGLLSSVFVFRRLKRNLTTASGQSPSNEVFLTVGFLVFTFFGVFFLFSYFLVGFARIESYSMLFATLLVGERLARLTQSDNMTRNPAQRAHKRIRLRSFLATTIVVLLICVSTFNLYLSPITRKENQHVTESELVGMKWFFEHRDKSMLTYELGLSQLTFHHALFGDAVPTPNLRYGSVTTPLDHFGYSNGSSMATYYGVPGYLLVTTLGRAFYPEIYPTYTSRWRFTPDDFERLDHDSNALRIFDGGDLTIYYFGRHGA